MRFPSTMNPCGRRKMLRSYGNETSLVGFLVWVFPPTDSCYLAEHPDNALLERRYKASRSCLYIPSALARR